MKDYFVVISHAAAFSLALILILSCTVSADMGPKASVNIKFSGMSDEPCYGTLLSSSPSTGPSSVWDGDEISAYHNGNERYPNAPLSYEIWLAFVEYEDADGYYFLQDAAWLVNEKKELTWGYYPPDQFKILLYFPESDTFAVSDVLQRYAFDTYYTVDMSGLEMASVSYDKELSGNSRINAYRSYMWRQELGGLAVRILLTILIELAAALLFGLREKKQLLVLTLINIFTQIVLNVLLNYIDYSAGYTAFVISYALIEMLVFVLEAIFCCLFMNKLSSKQRSKQYYISYALTANLSSFLLGMIISNYLPIIF